MSPILRRDNNSATGADVVEVQANQFAAALLMPKILLLNMLGNELFDIDDDSIINKISNKFRVSKQALEHRIRNII
jgi:Zn-dependent peptidase ImmA (M78 family)